MRLLLDTQIALWALVDSARLGDLARGLIGDPANEVFVSSASLWEIAIKHGLGRGDMPVSGRQAEQLFDAAGYRRLEISWRHAVAVEELPPIHADPFDRLLIAQALSEPMRLVSRDAMLARYGAMVLPA